MVVCRSGVGFRERTGRFTRKLGKVPRRIQRRRDADGAQLLSESLPPPQGLLGRSLRVHEPLLRLCSVRTAELHRAQFGSTGLTGSLRPARIRPTELVCSASLKRAKGVAFRAGKSEGERVLECVDERAKSVCLGRQGCGVVVLVDRRLEGAEVICLLPQIDDVLVGFVQFAELGDRVRRSPERLRLVQHKRAEELVERAEVLRRLRLVQEVQRVQAVQTHQATNARIEAGMRPAGGDDRIRPVGLRLPRLDARLRILPKLEETRVGAVDEAEISEVVLVDTGAAQMKQPQHRDMAAGSVGVPQQNSAPGRLPPKVGGDCAVDRAIRFPTPGAPHVAHEAAVVVSRGAF